MRRLFFLAVPWLVGALLLGQYGVVVAQSINEAPVTRETIQSLVLDFNLQQTLETLDGCSERVDCKSYFSEDVGFDQVQTSSRPPFEVEIYRRPAIDTTHSIVLYVLYFQKGIDPYGEIPVLIDAGINPQNRQIIKKIKALIGDAYDTVTADEGLMHWLGRLALDGMAPIDIMIYEKTNVKNDYTIRYLVKYQNKKDDLLSQADRINDYFVNAIHVYASTGEEAARVAILAAGKVAASVQRSKMINYLKDVANELRATGGGQDKAAAKRLLFVVKELEEKDWTIKDIIQEKRRLEALNKDYVDALNATDPSVFSRYYPSLFGD